MYKLTKSIIVVAVVLLVGCKEKKDCYTCIVATKGQLVPALPTITRDTIKQCGMTDVEVSAFEQSKIKHWVSNDTVYNVAAKCIK